MLLCYKLEIKIQKIQKAFAEITKELIEIKQQIHHNSGGKDRNNDQVFIFKGLNGIIYRFVKCTHNPSHTSADPTEFDSDDFRRRLDRT